jgi:superfamily I DNA/RNA helicase
VQGFWDSEVPLILEQALEVLGNEGAATPFDAVVVDEAQDFSPDWWVTIESLTRRGRAGRLYAFLDLHQSLRGDPQLPSVPLPTHFRLLTNCRNTQQIAKSAACLAQVEVAILPSSPAGEAPATRRAPSETAEAGIVLGEVRQLLKQGLAASQIVLMGPAAYEKGLLGRYREVDGVALIDDASDWRRGGGILVTTARSFKGLEADVVIIYGLNSFGMLFTRTDLYVAWTRARHRLVIVCQAGEVRAAVEASLADAEGTRKVDTAAGG